MKRNDPVYTATVLYDFNATSSEELSLRTGQKIWLAPQSLQPKDTPGWLKATDSVKVGLVPYTYINVVGQLKRKPETNETLRADGLAESATPSANQKEKCDFANLEATFDENLTKKE